MVAYFRLVVVLAVVLVLTILIVPVQILMLSLSHKFARHLPVYWHRFLLWSFGIKVRNFGRPSTEHPLLLVANHVSWKDILVLGAVQPLSFIAKSDMKTWPVLGPLARLQRTIFVEREKPRKTVDQASEIAERLNAGDVIVLFAEGTTSDGNKILPFNSSLVGAAQLAIRKSGRSGVVVQPVAIAYTKMHGLALGRYFRPDAAWPGDVGLAPHLVNIVKHGALDVELHFGEPIEFSADSNRKSITHQIETQVRTMVNRSLRGHDQPVPITKYIR